MHATRQERYQYEQANCLNRFEFHNLSGFVARFAGDFGEFSGFWRAFFA
jgi:hypothetical protein